MVEDASDPGSIDEQAYEYGWSGGVTWVLLRLDGVEDPDSPEEPDERLGLAGGGPTAVEEGASHSVDLEPTSPSPTDAERLPDGLTSAAASDVLDFLTAQPQPDQPQPHPEPPAGSRIISVHTALPLVRTPPQDGWLSSCREHHDAFYRVRMQQ